METDRGQVTATSADPVLLAQYFNVATECPAGLVLPADRAVEIVGAPGTGFAENTLCVHRVLTPKMQIATPAAAAVRPVRLRWNA
jgi:hypothetical protein